MLVFKILQDFSRILKEQNEGNKEEIISTWNMNYSCNKPTDFFFVLKSAQTEWWRKDIHTLNWKKCILIASHCLDAAVYSSRIIQLNIVYYQLWGKLSTFIVTLLIVVLVCYYYLVRINNRQYRVSFKKPYQNLPVFWHCTIKTGICTSKCC